MVETESLHSLTTFLKLKINCLKATGDGIEIEMNQLHVVKKTGLWDAVMEKLSGCIGEVIGVITPQ